MAGYKGYSMSNNAIAAYENGERPLSKWTKTDLLREVARVIEDDELLLTYDPSELRVLPLAALRSALLSWSSWHHTSDHYNVTDFYTVNPVKVEALTSEQIAFLAASAKEQAAEAKARKEAEKVGRPAFCRYLVWSGTRKHPKAETVEASGIIRGNWFFPENGDGKKSVTANGFCIIREGGK